jgi:hypothetical protein
MGPWGTTVKGAGAAALSGLGVQAAIATNAAMAQKRDMKRIGQSL